MLSVFVCLPVLGGNSAENARKHGIFERHVKIVMLHNGFEDEKVKAQCTQTQCLQGLTDCCAMLW